MVYWKDDIQHGRGRFINEEGKLRLSIQDWPKSSIFIAEFQLLEPYERVTNDSHSIKY